MGDSEAYHYDDSFDRGAEAADEPPSDCRYDRAVLVDVLVYHWPTGTSGCTCGWAVLGASFPEHVADVYEASVMARG